MKFSIKLELTRTDIKNIKHVMRAVEDGALSIDVIATMLKTKPSIVDHIFKSYEVEFRMGDLLSNARYFFRLKDTLTYSITIDTKDECLGAFAEYADVVLDEIKPMLSIVNGVINTVSKYDNTNFKERIAELDLKYQDTSESKYSTATKKTGEAVTED